MSATWASMSEWGVGLEEFGFSVAALVVEDDLGRSERRVQTSFCSM